MKTPWERLQEANNSGESGSKRSNLSSLVYIIQLTYFILTDFPKKGNITDVHCLQCFYFIK